MSPSETPGPSPTRLPMSTRTSASQVAGANMARCGCLENHNIEVVLDGEGGVLDDFGFIS